MNGYRWCPCKEKAELLKIIFSKKNTFSELLATEKTKKNTPYPRFSAGIEHNYLFQLKLSLIICKKGGVTESGWDKIPECSRRG